MTKVINQSDTWNNIRANLNNSYAMNSDWTTAIDLFSNRFYNHYFIPLDRLVMQNDYQGEGFTILTVICSFIEALAAFEKGKIYNVRYNPRNDPSFEYSNSRDLYISFLHSASVFENNFWRMTNGLKVTDQPFSGTDFYESVRCALIHEGRTKNNWSINARKADNLNSTVFMQVSRGKNSVMRSIFYTCMLNYLTSYTSRLKEATLAGELIRRLFARKMDHLFEIPRDHFDWWIDR